MPSRPHEDGDPRRRRFCLRIILGLAATAEGMGLLGCSVPGRHLSPAGSARPSPSPTPSESIEPETVRSAMTRVADWQLEHLSGYPPHDWTVAPFWVGLLSFALLSRAPDRYLESARANGRRNGWQPGPEPFLADDLAITQSYFMLYGVDRDRAEIAPALARFDALLGQSFDDSLEFSHDTALRQWVWCDALFMAPPALALASRVTGDPRYRALMQRLWWKTTDFLYDRDAHLYYRDSRFFGRHERNGAKVFWSRGNGWVLAGLARVLQYLPADAPGRGRFVTLFLAMAAKVAALQGSDGYWRASLLDPDSWPAPETSGTAFFTYALAWGVNEGLLERARYEAAVRNGWAALVRVVQPDGKLGYVQRPGDRPADTGPGDTEPYGTGAFLLAGSEVYRLAVRAGR
jgi:unsaturated rhamnogalacturonyl hydrolase